MKYILGLLVVFYSHSTFAEYRAYQYIIKSHDQFAEANGAQAQIVTSTLNPAMFKSYHGGSFLSVSLLRTWICPGYTGGRKDICPHPYDQEDPK